MLITIQMNRTAILQTVRKSGLKEDNTDRNGVRNEHGISDLKAESYRQVTGKLSD